MDDWRRIYVTSLNISFIINHESKPVPWVPTDENYVYAPITIYNDNTKKWAKLDRWVPSKAYQVNFKNYKCYDDINDYLDASDAFISVVYDAISGTDSFEKFCYKHKFKTDSRESECRWNICKKSKEKLDRVYGGNLFEIIEMVKHDMNEVQKQRIIERGKKKKFRRQIT